MIAISEEQKRLNIVREAQSNLYISIFSTKYVAEYFALAMVFVSICLAIFIPYIGLFPTSQSKSMSNYHRWLYDLFVIVSSCMGPILYFIFKHKMQHYKVRQHWYTYVKAHAIFKKYKHDLAVKQGKKKYLVGLWSERVFLILMIVGLIMIYAFIVPSGNSRRGGLFIQAWWPISAGVIALLYYAVFWVYFRLFASAEINRQYQALERSDLH